MCASALIGTPTPGVAALDRATTTTAQSSFDAGLRTAVRALATHVPDEQHRCVACGMSWPCGPAVTAEHNVELLHPQAGRPAG